MKFLKVFSLVALGHFLLIGAFLLQPGCQSIDRQWEEHRKENQSVNVPQVVLAQEQGLPVDSEEIDPSFNSGFSGSGQDGRAARARGTPSRPEGGLPGSTELPGLEPSELLFNPGLADGFNSGAVPAPSPSSGYVPYTVKRGDTLWSLSKEHNVSFAALLEANGMSRDSQLRVGQEIVVPSGYEGEELLSGGSDEPTQEPGTSIYEVRRGDTLSEIAARAGTSVSRIKNLNNMSGDRIRIGQRLIVPGEVVVPEGNQRTPSPVDVDPGDFTAVYTVKSGDTPSGIANRYGMSVDELLAANGISDPRRMRVGTELKVRPAGSGAKLSSPSGRSSDSGGDSASDILPARASGSLPARAGSPSPTPSPDAAGEDAVPTAPEIVPEVNSVEPEEGFGPDIFDDFEGVEEVPTERRDSDGS